MHRNKTALILLSACLVGCGQSFLELSSEQARDFGRYRTEYLAADALASANIPLQSFASPIPDEQAALDQLRPVSTVAFPAAPKRPISLQECICLALENGRTGEFYDRVGGERHTSVVGLQRQTTPSNATDSIRVFAYDPAMAASEMEQSLARFDALWRTSATWTGVERPTGLNDTTVPEVGVLEGQRDNVHFESDLIKPLPTGGLAGITFRTDYVDAFRPDFASFINPAYQPGVDFTFEQPLLQGGGVFLNQLRETLVPGQLLSPTSNALPGSGRVPAILIARIARDQTQLEFERRVQEVVFAVEDAYWDLYSAYWDLYTRESGLRQVHMLWELAKQRYDAGGLAADDLSQIEEQYHQFRTQRLESLGNGVPGRPGVLEAERRLRYVVGLPHEDGCRLIPIDAPCTTPLQPDWADAVQTARVRDPLLQIEKDIEATRLLLVRSEDYLRPDLRLISRYGLNGVDTGLGSSLGALTSRPFSSWEVGLQLEVPLGFRAGHAEVVRAKLELAQRYAFLHDQDSKLISSLQRSYRDLVQPREELITRRSQREASAQSLKVRYARFKAKGEVSSDLLVRSQRAWADALRDEYAAICRYNVARADFERQKGTILSYHHVSVVEGCVPSYAHDRAGQQLRELSKAVLPQETVAPQMQSANGDPGDPASLPELVSPQHEQILTYLRPGQPQVAPPGLFTPTDVPPPLPASR